MILTAAERADIRADVEREIMVDTCTVIRTPRVQNDSGGYIDGTPVSTDVACRLGPPGFGSTGRERVQGGQVVAESDGVLTLPNDADVRSSDRITHNGTTYEIVDILERSERLVQRVFVRGMA